MDSGVAAILKLVLIPLLGALAVAGGLLKKEAAGVLSALLTNLCYPVMILHTFWASDLRLIWLENGLTAMVAVVASFSTTCPSCMAVAAASVTMKVPMALPATMPGG